MALTPRIGTVFAGYRIEALRGRGGMSVVYRAENPRLGNVVALKLLSPELAEDESFRERFVRESRTAASMAHPNIVPIYDAGDAEGVLYIAMRYVEGPDLKALVKEPELLPPVRVLRIGGQVASALDAAHARGLIHRDVKPANILLEVGAEGEDHAYLADFGLTKHVDSHSGITGSGQFVGTIDYMAPEQIEGREVDARADLYALGCVLYECLAGSPPYTRETEVAILWAHMRDEPPMVSTIRPDLPTEIDDVLAKALAKDPDQRYESCGELVDDLRAALGEPSPRPVEARTVRAPARERSGDPPVEGGLAWAKAGRPHCPLGGHAGSRRRDRGRDPVHHRLGLDRRPADDDRANELSASADSAEGRRELRAARQAQHRFLREFGVPARRRRSERRVSPRSERSVHAPPVRYPPQAREHPGLPRHLHAEW